MKYFLIGNIFLAFLGLPLSLTLAEEAPKEGVLMQMDTNKDKKISKEEFIAFFEKRAREKAEQKFKTIDANSDGEITIDEIQKARGKGTAPQEGE